MHFPNDLPSSQDASVCIYVCETELGSKLNNLINNKDTQAKQSIDVKAIHNLLDSVKNHLGGVRSL
jgi:hypothetical protein